VGYIANKVTKCQRPPLLNISKARAEKQESVCSFRNSVHYVNELSIKLELGTFGTNVPLYFKNKPVARKSIVAARDIKEGEEFTGENLTTKRPGTGISPMRWDEVLKKKATRNCNADEIINL